MNDTTIIRVLVGCLGVLVVLMIVLGYETYQLGQFSVCERSGGIYYNDGECHFLDMDDAFAQVISDDNTVGGRYKSKMDNIFASVNLTGG